MEKPALLGGTPVRATAYPLWPVFDERDIEVVTAVVKSGNWGGFPYPGPQTAEFVRRFLALQNDEPAASAGVLYAVAMANGTVTMDVARRAAGTFKR